MSSYAFEAIPHTDSDNIAAQFEWCGHAAISGLVDPELLEPAVAEARKLSSYLKGNQRYREWVAQIRTPDSETAPALQAVLKSMQTGIALIGRDSVAEPGEKMQIEFSDKEPQTRSRQEMYGRNYLGALVSVNLHGQSYQAITSGENGIDVDYVLNEGDVMIHDPIRDFTTRSCTGFDDRLGLTVARIAPRIAPEVEAYLAKAAPVQAIA